MAVQIEWLREDVKNTQRGGVYIFWGGCRPYSPILGGVYMKINQFGGVSLNFTRIWGGLLFSLKKCQNGGSVNIFHQIWPNYRENLLIFCFFLGGSENFSLKNFFREGDLGGVYTELLNFGGGLDGIGRKWGGSAFGARRAPNWYTPPLGCL